MFSVLSLDKNQDKIFKTNCSSFNWCKTILPLPFSLHLVWGDAKPNPAYEMDVCAYYTQLLRKKK